MNVPAGIQTMSGGGAGPPTALVVLPPSVPRPRLVAALPGDLECGVDDRLWVEVGRCLPGRESARASRTGVLSRAAAAVSL